MLKITKLLINNAETLSVVDERPFFTIYMESDDRAIVPTGLTAQLRDVTAGLPESCTTVVLDPGTLHDIRLPDSAVLLPHHSYRIRFRITDSEGGITFSEDRAFSFAYPKGALWNGSFISSDCPDETGVMPVFEFRRDFSLPSDVCSAQLYITANGLYTPFLNGVRVGNDVLTPGWFTYYKHLAYQVYDVSSLLRGGDNQLSVLVGDGWYKGFLTSSWHRNYYGDRRRLLWELHIRRQDGTEVLVCSDGQSLWRKTSILVSEIYSGEICDRTVAEDGWQPVQLQPCSPEVQLHVSEAAPAHYLEPSAPRCILTTPNGETVVDFGRILTGVVEVSASMPRGTTLQMEFGDTLGPDGNFYNENVELFSLRDHGRPSVQKVTYTFAGAGTERYRPSFTYQCFRYMRISGMAAPMGISNFLAYPISSFTRQTGTFQCGDALVNTIFENTIRTEIGTFMDIPVAGPMRAERLGWTGDNQLMFPLALRTMFESYGFLGKWLKEVRYSQGADGQVGTLAPYVNFEPGSTCKDFRPEASAIWGDAAVICPWLLYEFYGDLDILRQYRDLAKGYVDYMRSSGDCETTFTEGETFGDWFALDNGEDAYPGKTSKALLGNIYYYRSTDILCKILRALGDPAETEYTALAQRIRRQLHTLYFTDGYLTEPTQAGAALVLAFGIADQPEKVGQQLCRLLEDSDGHLLTGFTGTSVILQVLCRLGRPDLAVDAVRKRDYPSWGYTIERGATTIWEHFNGVKPDGSYWDPNMNSFCHLTFGSIVEWFYGYLLGLRQQEGSIAYEKILVDPVIVPEIGFVKGSFDSAYGTIRSQWTCRESTCTIRLQLPYGTQAVAVLRDVKDPRLFADRLQKTGYENIQIEGNTLKVPLTWGRHSFEYQRI